MFKQKSEIGTLESILEHSRVVRVHLRHIGCSLRMATYFSLELACTNPFFVKKLRNCRNNFVGESSYKNFHTKYFSTKILIHKRFPDLRYRNINQNEVSFFMKFVLLEYVFWLECLANRQLFTSYITYTELA